MTYQSGKPQPPLTLTISDITETRVGQTSRMHWPVDPETTAKLNRVIRLDASAPLPWWRRALRRLKGVK
jgi:hypothetical protein